MAVNDPTILNFATSPTSITDSQNIALKIDKGFNDPITIWIRSGTTKLITRTGVLNGTNNQSSSTPLNYTLTLSEADRNLLRQGTTGKSRTLNYYAEYPALGSDADDYAGLKNFTYTVIDANPVFNPVLAYKDNNSTTTTITGDDQYLIQGNSILEVDLDGDYAATALKYATMSKYNFAIAGYSVDETYTTSDIAKTIGAINAATDQLLTVKAVDSRGYETPATTTVKMVPYAAPQIIGSGVRQNNFEDTTTIHIEGLISLITIGGSNKNAVNTSTGVSYRYREVGGTFSSWTDRTSSTNSTTGAVSTTDFTLSLDNTKAWEVEVRITDKLNTITSSFIVDVGIPIFRIGTDGHLYNNEQPLMPSHVGMVIMSTTLAVANDVDEMYGGTWTAWGVGRVPVGVNTAETEFNTVEKTGGHKLLQSHSHAPSSLDRFGLYQNTTSQETVGEISGSGWNILQTTGSVGTGTRTAAEGGGNAQNLQPYITVYFWKRTV